MGIRRLRRGEDGGFTFVEVLTVIIILAVLSLIAIATFLGQRDKAERSRAVSALRNAETFAIAIRSDEPGFSECVSDYEAEAGTNAPYRWKEDASSSSDGSNLAHASIDANEISVYGPNDPCDVEAPSAGWVSMASLARDDCFYNLLVPASDDRIRHRAAAQTAPDGEPYCEGSEVTPAPTSGRITFRGTDVEPSGW